MRGLLYVELRACDSSRDLHSGNWGGLVPNPAWTLVRLLGTMRDGNGRVTIPGFNDRARLPTPVVKAAMGSVPLDQQDAMATVGIDFLPPEDPGAKTVIPSTATVKMDKRLVPYQCTGDSFAKFQTHMFRHAPDVEVLRLGSMEPWYTPQAQPGVDRNVSQARAIHPMCRCILVDGLPSPFDMGEKQE